VGFVRTFAFVLLAIIVTGVPTLACFVPDAQLTAEERDCCKHMADMCGPRLMPTSHSCCKTAIRGNEDVRIEQQRSTAPAMDVVTVVSELTQPAIINASLSISIAASPPESLPSSIPVLRI
jgi:hypothetical protein